MYCRKCGTALTKDSEFCHKCGAKNAPAELGPNEEVKKIFNPKLNFLKTVSAGIEFILFVLAAKWLGAIPAIILTVVVFGVGYLVIKLLLKIIGVPLYVVPTQGQLEKISNEQVKRNKTNYKALFVIIAICVIGFIALLLYLNSQGEL